MAKAKTLRFGFAGLGVASAGILPVFEGRPHVAVTAAADLRPHALAQFAQEFEGETYESVEEMCKSPNLDAVYVCSPNHLHAQHAIVAANHGKHVIVEKPMAVSLEECEAMIAAAERNGVKLLSGHTHSLDPPIQKIRDIVKSGELGNLGMINSWNFNQFMYRPRMPHEMDPSLGGNMVFNQGPHQADIVRFIGGGMVRSVRAMTGIWDIARRTEGAWAAYLEFEDGTPATLVYNGYGHFDSGEFCWWIGEGGRRRDPESNLRSRAELRQADDETALKESRRYAGSSQAPRQTGTDGEDDWQQRFFGVTIVSCAHGDIRQSPRGLFIYGDDRTLEIPLPKGDPGRATGVEELYDTVMENRAVLHSGRWGQATLEVVLGIMESARSRKEVYMSHQVRTSD